MIGARVHYLSLVGYAAVLLACALVVTPPAPIVLAFAGAAILGGVAALALAWCAMTPMFRAMVRASVKARLG